MCLVKDPNHFQVKTAVRPMLTYKIVRQMNPGFKTAYRLREIEVNKVTLAYPEKPLYEKNKSLTRGFIHSFSSIQTARRALRWFNNVSSTEHVILESYIPAGTYYYFDSINQEIASKKLLITDVIVK